MNSSLSFFDFFWNEPRLWINGGDRFKTKFGIMMGLVAVLVTGGLSIFFAYEFFARKKLHSCS